MKIKPMPARRATRVRPGRRDRHQLVIALGEGAEGRRRREMIEAAAVGQTLSSWALRALLDAAGAPVEGPVQRSELAKVSERVDEMALQVNKLVRMVTGRDR